MVLITGAHWNTYRVACSAPLNHKFFQALIFFQCPRLFSCVARVEDHWSWKDWDFSLVDLSPVLAKWVVGQGCRHAWPLGKLCAALTAIALASLFNLVEFQPLCLHCLGLVQLPRPGLGSMSSFPLTGGSTLQHFQELIGMPSLVLRP